MPREPRNMRNKSFQLVVECNKNWEIFQTMKKINYIKSPHSRCVILLVWKSFALLSTPIFMIRLMFPGGKVFCTLSLTLQFSCGYFLCCFQIIVERKHENIWDAGWGKLSRTKVSDNKSNFLRSLRRRKMTDEKFTSSDVFHLGCLLLILCEQTHYVSLSSRKLCFEDNINWK